MTRLDRTHAVHHVYRCYDETGRLLYVGSSANLFGRLTQHRRTSWWAGQVASVTAKVYPNGVVARERERHAIVTEHPRWNKSGRWNTRHAWTKGQWDDWLTMLLARGAFAAEMRRFITEYRKAWGVEPDATQVAAVVAAEKDRARQEQEIKARYRESQKRWAQDALDDELALRRERKKAKAKVKRLAKKTREAKAVLAECDMAVGKS